MIEIIDVLSPENTIEVPESRIVRFPVTSPVWTTPEGDRIRLAEPGHVDVICSDGRIEIRGAHAVSIDAHSSNSITVYLRDSMQPAKAENETGENE